MKKLLFLLMVLSIVYVHAAGSLVMVRSDNDENYLSSPSQMNFSALNNSFDTNKDTVIFIHGYMNNFSSCKSTYESAVEAVKTKLGNINYVGFHWPSKVAWFGTAIERASQAGPYVVHLAKHITSKYNGNGHKIHIISHSLGGHVTLSTLKQAGSSNVAWGTLCYMAPAVHNDAFQKSFCGVNERGQRVNNIYHSTRDGVLVYLYGLYDKLFHDDLTLDCYPDEIEKFLNEKTTEEQLAYWQALDEKIENEGYLPERGNELDAFLMEQEEKAKREAMGINGALPGTKIDNKNYHDYASSHSSYWEAANLKRIAGDIKLK